MLKKGRTKTTETERCEVQGREDSHLKEEGEEPELDKDALTSYPLSHWLNEYLLRVHSGLEIWKCEEIEVGEKSKKVLWRKM